MRFKRRGRRIKAEFNMTPLIDTVFNLLIFFLLTSSYIFQPGIKINLPKAVTSEVLKEEPLVITVTSEDAIYLNDKIATVQELISKLKKVSKEKGTLLIKADKKASVGRVVEIWDMCREAGVPQVNIATSQEQK
ncbi:MAG: biopolymer transporter ExbD [Candidatus Omnitrophica bacterium]|nr:biopolymer transporter ExbD [Candidatus Omnitrophota bacterium]